LWHRLPRRRQRQRLRQLRHRPPRRLLRRRLRRPRHRHQPRHQPRRQRLRVHPRVGRPLLRRQDRPQHRRLRRPPSQRPSRRPSQRRSRRRSPRQTRLIASVSASAMRLGNRPVPFGCRQKYLLRELLAQPSVQKTDKVSYFTGQHGKTADDLPQLPENCRRPPTVSKRVLGVRVLAALSVANTK
ncbi:unnamed protein product, partial [Ectocarpus fasciculatus]